jgi:hypothetical protein
MRAWIACVVLGCGCKTDPAPAASPAPAPSKARTLGRLAPVTVTATAALQDPAKDPWSSEYAPHKERLALQRGDLNLDGELSADETAMLDYDKAVAMHARLDRDGDGIVTVIEACEPQGYRISGEPGDCDLDTDRDGNVSVEELEAYLAELRELVKSEQSQR